MPVTAEPGRPEPGSSENPLRLNDPRMMRALAHPARIAILQNLAVDGPATATECAQIAGLSPSACSYHLRALARYGLVEEDPGSAPDGRHRPWRARVIAMSINDEPGQPAAVVAAGRLLKESLLASFDELRAQYLDRESSYPAEWRGAAGHSQDVLHVTAAELESLRGHLQEMLAGYRRLDRAARPPGAQRVHALLDLVPGFDPEAAPSDPEAAP
jgi:DNA-binding transcriptional ArsR family regulator